MAERVFDDTDKSWSYELEEGVAIFHLKGWQGFPDEELESASKGYREVASQESIHATIAILDKTKALPPATQDFMAKQWSENGRYVNVDKIGFVSEGAIGLTIKANIDVPDSEIEAFDDLEEAKEWARE